MRKGSAISPTRKSLRQIVAEWLALGMRQSGLSQTALAEKSGVSRATVNRLAQGRQDAEQPTIQRLARAMKYPFPDLDAVFPGPGESNSKRYNSSGGGSRGLRVRESSSGGDDVDAAYLTFALTMTRQLAAAEREGATQQALLRLVDLAEKVAVPIHGLRAKAFLDDERARIRRGETLDGGSTP